MKFFRLKFRRADIFLIPIMCVVFFFVQYYLITKQHPSEDAMAKKLDKLGKECREGKKSSCDEYNKIMEKIYKNQ